MQLNHYELILILNVLSDYVQFLKRQDNDRARERAERGNALINKLMGVSTELSTQETERLTDHKLRARKAWATRRAK